jgi:hypothetical protein
MSVEKGFIDQEIKRNLEVFKRCDPYQKYNRKTSGDSEFVSATRYLEKVVKKKMHMLSPLIITREYCRD